MWLWRNGYQIINRANSIIDNAVKEGINWTIPEDQNRVLAEARFIRAWSYKYMVLSFGDIPLLKNELLTPRTDFTRDPASEVWDLIVEDLEFAVDNLPESTTKNGKLVKAAAQHFLAETYLFTGDYDLAEINAKAVVDNPNYQLMTNRFGSKMNEPGDVFHDLFELHNQNLSENKEAIWVIQYELNELGGESPIYLGRHWTPRYFSVAGLKNEPVVYDNGQGTYRPTDYFLGLYETNDIRNSEYNLRRTWFYNDAANLPEGKSLGDTVEITASNERFLYPCTQKFRFPYNENNINYSESRHDRYNIRLAETYLILAEAQFRLGQLDDAADALNVVRSRSNASLITAGDVDIDFILEERARELFAEYPRRFDLLRTGTLIEKVKAYNPEGGPNIQDFHVLFPIWRGVIQANVDLEFPQNPGYPL